MLCWSWLITLLVGVAHPGAPEAVERALRFEAWPRPATDAWDAQARHVLLGAHDADDNGSLEGAELAAIACVEWAGLDRAVRRRWGSGLWVVYGVRPDGDWVLDVLGVPVTERAQAGQVLAGCGLAVEGFGPSADRHVDVSILGLLSPGEAPWDAAVRRILVDRLDGSGEGLLDRVDEVAAVDCSTWHLLDRLVRARWSQGVYLTYGMADGLVWLGDALGFDRTQRGAVRAALLRCAVPDAARRTPVPSTSQGVAEVVQALPGPGGEAWEALVRSLLLHVHDRDGSGELDQPAEIRAMSCALWDALDAALEDGGGLAVTYGIRLDGSWQGWRLGFAGAARSLAVDAWQACGTTGDADAVTAKAGGPHLQAWDEDGSGRVDRAAEVRAVPCGVWQAWTDHLEATRALSPTDVWGLRPGQVWSGDQAGLDPRVRGPVRRALRRCATR